jgi:hypothetical protein
VCVYVVCCVCAGGGGSENHTHSHTRVLADFFFFSRVQRGGEGEGAKGMGHGGWFHRNNNNSNSCTGRGPGGEGEGGPALQKGGREDTRHRERDVIFLDGTAGGTRQGGGWGAFLLHTVPLLLAHTHTHTWIVHPAVLVHALNHVEVHTATPQHRQPPFFSLSPSFPNPQHKRRRLLVSSCIVQ